MFEFLGAILRLPFGLVWIGFAFLTWPFGLAFYWLVLLGVLFITPFKFAGFAFSGDKAGWKVWQKEFLDFESVFKDSFYPFTMIPKIFKWVGTGK